mgnify:CR=1 FL=1
MPKVLQDWPGDLQPPCSSKLGLGADVAMAGAAAAKLSAGTAQAAPVARLRLAHRVLDVGISDDAQVLAARFDNLHVQAPINQIDVSGQWPLYGRWHGVGRVNYSFKDDGVVLSTGSQGGRVIESIAGLEYNGGCWVARGVVQRTALTQASKSTAFFIQLELNDFARVGSNPLDLLKRNIQGYSLINKPAANSAFGE